MHMHMNDSSYSCSFDQKKVTNTEVATFQELVDELLRSLVNHSALNVSTLKALRKCELGQLPLQRCRGVSDEWLIALNNEDSAPNANGNYQYLDEEVDNSSSTSSFHSAFSTPRKLPMTSPLLLGDNAIADIAISTGTTMVDMRHVSATASTTVLDLRGSQKLTDRGLLHLQYLSALEVVRLDHCHSISGYGLIAFSNSHLIHTLTMSNCRCLTDEAISKIGHLSLLTSLALDGCRCLTNISLRTIGALTNLTKLDVSQCDLLTDDALIHLHQLIYLEELSLGWCRRITDRGIQILADQPLRQDNLLTLCLARCQISSVGVRHLARLKALQNLDLNGCCEVKSFVLGETLSSLGNLQSIDVSYCPGILRSSWQGKIDSLKVLDLCYAAVKDVHLSRFTNLPLLEELNFDSCAVGDWSLAHLVDNNVVPNLTSLSLGDCDISDEGMAHLPKFTKLKSLSLFYCDISNAGLQHLSTMNSLENLNLDSRDISDDGLYYLRKLNLKCLDIFSGRITDVGCVHIGKIKSLECLELCGGSIGDLGCSQLAENLENLTSLNLAQNELITNNGAFALAALSKLKSLNLSYTSASASSLLFFKGLRQLQSLAMYGCRGVRKGKKVESLHSEMPNLKCLRIDGSSENDGTVDISSFSQEGFSSHDKDDNSISSEMDYEDLSFGDDNESEDDEHCEENMEVE